jgi:hypothetical protein
MPQVKVKSKPVPTRAEAEQQMEKFYRDYHPAGYATSLVLKGDDETGWYFEGTRWDSCD